MAPDTVVYRVISAAGEGSSGVLTATAVLGAAGAFLAAFFGAYTKQHGERLATAHDFERALRELQDTTRGVERAKAEVETRQALDGELRRALEALTTALARLLHSMAWVTWDARARGRLSPELARGYDQEAHALLPEVMGQLALVASYDAALHGELGPLVEHAIALDAEVGDAAVLCERDAVAGLAALSAAHARATAAEVDLRTRVAGVVGRRFGAAGAIPTPAG